MSKAHPPELKKFMDKKLDLKLNGGRNIRGFLRGFDPFMNLVIDEGVGSRKDGTEEDLGMVAAGSEVCTASSLAPAYLILIKVWIAYAIPINYKQGEVKHFEKVVRGNSILMLEAVDRI